MAQERKIWIVRIELSDGSDFAEMVFDDWDEYELFAHDKPATAIVTDIYERPIVSYKRAVGIAAALGTEAHS